MRRTNGDCFGFSYKGNCFNYWSNIFSLFIIKLIIIIKFLLCVKKIIIILL